LFFLFKEYLLIQEYKEDISSDFVGTIIDIETIGSFNERYRNTGDRREYHGIQQVIFGIINDKYLRILYITKKEEVPELNKKITEIVDELEKPFYAFNTAFEHHVLSHQLGREVVFECELQREKFESKFNAVRELKIDNHGDPFNDKGIMCMYAWQNGEFDKAIAHNRACLLKERDILLQRGYRKPNGLALFLK
jgi:hypothetical protein